MPCIHLKDGGVLTVGAPDLRIVDSRGREWLFEMHDYCGPVVTNRRTGDPLDKQPDERSPFWHAVQCWIDQEKRCAGDLCEWREPPPIYVRDMGDGKNFLVVKNDGYKGLAERRQLLVPAEPVAGEPEEVK